jgi:hypothetical protein
MGREMPPWERQWQNARRGGQQRKCAWGGAAFNSKKKTKSEATRSTSVLGRPKAEKVGAVRGRGEVRGRRGGDDGDLEGTGSGKVAGWWGCEERGHGDVATMAMFVLDQLSRMGLSHARGRSYIIKVIMILLGKFGTELRD